MRMRGTTSIVFGLLLQVTAAGAQTAADPAFERLRQGDLLRIRTGQLLPVEGRFARLAADSLGATWTGAPRYLVLDGEAGSVAIRDIDQVMVRGNAAGRGALWGAGIVGVLGGAFLYSMCSAFRDNPTPALQVCWGALPIGALIGALPGAGIGALLGSTAPRWRVKYQRVAPIPVPQ